MGRAKCRLPKGKINFDNKEVVMKVSNFLRYLISFLGVVAGVLGAILGAICFYLLPDIVPATNVIVAIVIGASSGLTSVGFNQVIKQVTKGDDSNGTKSD